MSKTTEFKITETQIPGLFEIDISLIEDDRGYFQEKFQKAKLVAAGFPKDFSPVQQNISYNKQSGVTRGLHAEPWEKYVSIITGKAFGAYVDLRKGKNFGKLVTIQLNATKAVFVPRGVANSYQTLTSDVCYSYLVNEHWSQDAKYLSVNLADADLDIDWPINLKDAIISDKDLKNPRLQDIKPF
ncbi:MAG TPA: dTDP-4-dehydrorhamnose 3,5-epimerase family protein [Methylomirabilota bacterium]|nr:dTDP-4-dehydrorhamnose 3,5-epimerase family protein [Methylomirabilota bacterium]